MATILLSAAGAAIGGAVGGTALGLSSVAIGRFAGAVIGRSIDQRLLGQGSDVVESGRVNRLRLTGAGEGDAIAQVYGRMRVAGQLIWATEFREEVSVTPGSRGGGKGTPRPATPTTRQISYSVSIALALCEGEISNLARVWADGTEIAKDSLNMRVYRGTRDQLPDPKIEAVEGAGNVPAYRGTAYVVIEALDIGAYGNRVPQFSFEVCRPSQIETPGADLDPTHAVRGVAMLPGSGEYVLATTPVKMNFGPGSAGLANINTPSEKSDFSTSLEALTAELPTCHATSLVVSWFGDDLRCGECQIRPRVEQKQYESTNMPWQVSSLTRAAAGTVPRDADDREVYGGTPSDQSVIEAILSLQQAGQDVLYYPFILMEQMPGNGLPDPYSDAGNQAVLPWRGRITTAKAPGQDGSNDGSPLAETEVAAFFGTARASDFTVTPINALPQSTPGTGALDLLSFGGAVKVSPVSYHGPDEWSYRRFVLHQAALCAAVGGVESFCIGSEMRALTQIRGAANSFPAVAQLMGLAGEVRALLGPDVKIGYAADWSEYFGYQPGNGDRFFHLDPLWADDTIDFIGIDNYMPLSDWREGDDHLDADWGAIYDLDYLQSNIEGGEGYDWFYHSPEARAAQIRTPITDETYDEAWIWRFKDIRNWWQNLHHERVNGERQAEPTAWFPQSKPIRFTEYGCAAVDKGTNEPNKFVDPKSSESSLPRYSTGQRDELIQLQYLRATAGYWEAAENNPLSEEYDGRMIDMDHAYVWAWDARPYPFFPANTGLWSDGANYTRGHWITGRTSAHRLASVVEEIAARTGLRDLDTSELHGYLRGYLVDQVSEARGSLQPLMLRYGFDAIERAGQLQFRLRNGKEDHAVDLDLVVRDAELGGVIEETRGSDIELAGRVRLRFLEADGDYEAISEEAILPDDVTHAVATSEMPLAMTRAEGRQVVERWLSEARVSIDTLRLTLPPSQLRAGAGDILALPKSEGGGRFRIDRVDQMGNAQRIDAVRIEPESYRPILIEDAPARLRPFSAPNPVAPLFMDLPLLTGEEVPHAPHIAVMANPWPGSAALYASDQDANYALDSIIAARSTIGVTQSPLGPACSQVVDRGEGLVVRMLHGTLESITDAALLSGGNICAIGDGTPDGWELFQFRDAELVDTNTYILRHRLRGQLGTEGAGVEIWPEGSYLVRLNGVPQQINLGEAQRGLARHYRIGPGGRPVDDPAFGHAVLAFDGLGLRPYAPVHLRVAKVAGGNLAVSWIRRTRIGGDRWDTPEVPLGEESESYLLRVMRASAVLREVVVAAPLWTYPAAARAADGPQAGKRIEVAQISASFGPGSSARRDL
ncbi:Putative phage tail protein [Roseovarius marisflavi]|uniref:Putative phage tail protein n=1 Tax=Roseovarius marisflavi TaxID=1054996 RepID=A0A1M7D007_9RHOB|nr:glycoside hydrolase/phage tail family protein [Roseovarius marisflavi]SHL72743.1 Putative phage tail protein [Roseovarius marisflavi]